MQATHSAAVPLITFKWGLASEPLHHDDPDFPSTKAIVCKSHTAVVWCVKCWVGLRWDLRTHLHMVPKWVLREQTSGAVPEQSYGVYIFLYILYIYIYFPCQPPDLLWHAYTPPHTDTCVFVPSNQAISFSCFISILIAPSCTAFSPRFPQTRPAL